MALIKFKILLFTWILFTSLYDVTRASSEPSVFYIVDEEQPIGTLIGDVRKDATLDTEFNDRDLRTATFHFLTPRPTMFQVDANTGQVRTTERLDRETLCPTVVYCSLSAELAVQGAANFKVVIVKMVVTVLDINDNAPAFPTPKVSVGISEAAAVGTALTLPSAIDPDTLQFGVKEYRLVTSSPAASGSGVFELQVAKKNDGSTDVRLVLMKSLDRETASEHAVRIVAVDGGSPALSGTLEVTVDVRDANDHSPVFYQPSYQTSVSEDVPIRTNILRVHASDGDAGVNGRIVYALSEQTMKSFGRTFAIDNTTGVLYNLQNLDFETASSYALYIKAYDQGSEPLVAEVPVTIDVDDVNDNAPEITVSALYTSSDGEVVQVPENMAPGGFVAQVIVNDRDTSGDNGKVNCTMNDPYFRFSRRSDGKYQLLTTVTLDRERRDSYNLRVVCQDRGSPPLSSVRDISIAVLDDNDNGPVFERSRYEATMIERNYEEAFVIKVNATDLDIGKNGEITYSLSVKAAPYFQIDQHTGAIKALTSLDREKTPRLTFEVFASDGAKPGRNTSVEVTVTVLDVNDEKPQFALPAYYFTVVENSKAGKIIGNVSATDGDSEPNALITYSLSLTGSAIGMFFIDPTTGVISLTRAPDREMTARHYFTVLARDSGSPSLTGSASVTVSVGDVNDNAPIFRFPSGLNSSLVIPNNHPPGYVFSKVDAFDVDDGENGRLTYVISGGSDERNYFSIDSQYGAVMVNMDLSHVAYETITLEIVAKDNGQPQLSTTTVLVVIVNRSLAGLTTARNRGVSGMLLAGHNLTVMLALVALTILVIVLLVTTVACLKCNDRRRKAARYNCRMETIRALTSSGSSTSIKRGADGVGVVVIEAGGGGMMRHHGVTSCSDGVCDRLLKQDHQYGGCDDGFDKIRAGGESILKQEPSYYPQCNCCSSEHEINYLLDQLRQQHADDVISLRSTDGSNTDSGRGPSETGDMQHRVVPTPASTSASVSAVTVRAPTDRAGETGGRAAPRSSHCDVDVMPVEGAANPDHVTGAHYGYGPMSGCTFRPPPVGRLNSPPISAHQMAANQITSSGHMTFPTTRSTINASPYGYVTPPSVAVYNRQQPSANQQSTDMVTQYGRPQQQQLLMLKQQPITAVPNNRTWPSPIVERDELGAPATSKC